MAAYQILTHACITPDILKEEVQFQNSSTHMYYQPVHIHYLYLDTRASLVTYILF